MAVNLAVRCFPEPVRTLGFAAISGTYTGIGTAISNPVRIFFLQNLTDVTLMFSFDGINDHFPLPTNGFILLDLVSNSGISLSYNVAQGQRIYVRDFAGAPTTGAVYLTVFYGAV